MGEPASLVLALADAVRHRLDGGEPLRRRCRQPRTVSSCSWRPSPTGCCSSGSSRRREEASLVKRPSGRTGRRRVSLVLYALAMGLAFVSPWISMAIYAGAAIMWFVLTGDGAGAVVDDSARLRRSRPAPGIPGGSAADRRGIHPSQALDRLLGTSTRGLKEQTALSLSQPSCGPGRAGAGCRGRGTRPSLLAGAPLRARARGSPVRDGRGTRGLRREGHASARYPGPLGGPLRRRPGPRRRRLGRAPVVPAWCRAGVDQPESPGLPRRRRHPARAAGAAARRGLRWQGRRRRPRPLA